MIKYLSHPKLKFHTIPLLVVIAAIVLGQTAVLHQRPLVLTTPDTPSYLMAAHQILTSPKYLIQLFRPPGYPLFLILTGGLDHPARAVVGQAVISVLAVLECYLLAFFLTRRRWVACFVASAIALNVYILGWERTIMAEGLSWWSLITLFLCYERFMRSPGIGWGSAVAVVGFAAIMIHPFNLFFPFLLLVLALLRAWWRREFRLYWKGTSVAAALLCVCLLGYMGLNASFNGLFGVSYDPYVTLFGKIMEYRMYYFTVDAQYASIQADVQTYMQSHDANPWEFAASYLPTKDYAADNWNAPYNYTRYVILHHPGTYLVDSIPDLYYTWLAPPYFVSPTGSANVYSYKPLWVRALILVSILQEDSFWYLPLLLLVLGLLMWRRPRQMEQFLLLALALVVVGGIVLAAVGNYADFYRLRSPIDWAMILLVSIALSEVLRYVTRKEYQPLATLAPPKADPMEKTLEEADVPAAGHNGGAEQGVVTLPAESMRVSHHGSEPDPLAPEISIVLPCLNEEDAIGGCIDSIQMVIARQHLNAEILVVDNASTDRSAEIARERGVRVVYQPVRGYGNAYLKGFAEARGRYIVMVDADNTYDFEEIEALIEPLRQGYDLVVGNRFSGRMAKGAMTWSHRYIGNPILSGLLNLFFHTGIRDAHCGMRAFKIEAYHAMRLQAGGMEFASEMVINAAKAGLAITERPIAYHPRVGETKLRTIRDGWRHLRFLLLYSPSHLFLVPGVTLLLLGLLVLSVLLPGPFPLFGHSWDVNTMILASVVALIGLQIISLGLFARFFSLTEELDGERDRLLHWLTKRFSLERGLLIGGVVFGLGLVIDSVILAGWISEHMGPLNAVRPAIFATTLIAIGVQIMFGSFFLSFLQFRKSLNKKMQVPVWQSNEPVPVS